MIRASHLLAFFFLLLMGVQPVHGQRKADYQDEYLQAKRLFQQERWQAAMQAFSPLTSAERENAFAEYASFYYSLAAIQLDRTQEARAMLRQLQQRYPGWNKQPEVSYWLAWLYFKDNNYRQALAQVQDIRDKQVGRDAEKMATEFLMRETDPAILEILLKDFNEAYIAQALAFRISQQAPASQDRERLMELVRTYNLDVELLNRPEVAESEKKASYQVGVMLPFLLDDIKPEAGMHERFFVVDLYEGIELAQQELQQEGMRIKLHAYDTKRDSIQTQRILAKPELAEMDLLIGPLFPGPVKAATRFAFEQNINIVNPLSVNPENISGNPYSFLFKPSLETQGRKAAEFAARTFTDNLHTTVVYADKERDSLMAFAYRQEMLKNDYQVKMVKVSEGLEGSVRSVFVPDAELEQTLEDSVFHADSLGHVFVASDNELLIAGVISALIGRGDKLPLIGHEDWLRKNFISYDQLERMGVYFIAPEFIDFSSESYLEFRKRYRNNVNNLPTRYAYLGYELMMYFGRMMHQYGNHFQAVDNREPFTKGVLCTGFSYLNSNDNQCVPIIQFRDAALEVVYQ